MSKVAHLLALSLAFAFGIVGLGAGINAHVREQRDKDHAEGLAPAGTTFHINTRDIDSVGIVLIVGCALLAIAAAAFWITLSFLRRGPHKFQGHVFSFLAVWLLACNIAHTVIARTRSAGVSATLASGTPIPASIVAAGQRAAGISPVYWDQNYVRYYTIVPWVTFLTAVFAAVTSFRISREKRVEKV